MENFNSKPHILNHLAGFESKTDFIAALEFLKEQTASTEIASALNAVMALVMDDAKTGQNINDENIIFVREICAHSQFELLPKFLNTLKQKTSITNVIRLERVRISVEKGLQFIGDSKTMRLRPLSQFDLPKVTKNRLQTIHGEPNPGKNLEFDLEKRECAPEIPTQSKLSLASRENTKLNLRISKTRPREISAWLAKNVRTSVWPTGLLLNCDAQKPAYIYETQDIFHHFRALGRTKLLGGYENVHIGVFLPRIGLNNYYHALIDRVSLIWFASQIPEDIPILSSFEMGEMERKICRSMGLDFERITYSENGRHNVEHCLIPNYRAARNGFYQFARGVGQAHSREGASRKIYISRRRAKDRRLQNEAELETILAHKGFSIICLEDLRLDKQIEVMSSADCVVAPHGAGLANLIFCQPGTQVIEIIPQNYLNVLFAQIASDTDLDYTAVFGGEFQGKSWSISDANFAHIQSLLEQVFPEARNPNL